MVTTAELEQNRPSTLTVGKGTEKEILTEDESQVFIQMIGALGHFKSMRALGDPGTHVTAEMVSAANDREHLTTAHKRLTTHLNLLGIVRPVKIEGSHANSENFEVTEEAAPIKAAVQEALGLLATSTSPESPISEDEIYDALRVFRDQSKVSGPKNEHSAQKLITPLPLLVLQEAAQTPIITAGDLYSSTNLIKAGVSSIKEAFRGLNSHETLPILQPQSGIRRGPRVYELSDFGHVLFDQVMPMFAQRAKAVAATRRVY